MRNEWEGQSIFKRYTFWKWTAFFLADADAVMQLWYAAGRAFAYCRSQRCVSRHRTAAKHRRRQTALPQTIAASRLAVKAGRAPVGAGRRSSKRLRRWQEQDVSQRHRFGGGWHGCAWRNDGINMGKCFVVEIEM